MPLNENSTSIARRQPQLHWQKMSILRDKATPRQIERKKEKTKYEDEINNRIIAKATCLEEKYGKKTSLRVQIGTNV